jgi:hypothetical protein
MNRRRIERLTEEIKPAESSPTITAVTISSKDRSVCKVLFSDGKSKTASQLSAGELAKLKGSNVSYKVYFDIGPDDL